MDTALVMDPLFRRHATGPEHPECPERYEAVASAFDSAGLLAALPRVPVRRATEDELALCHTRPYIATARRDIASGAGQLSTGDTAVSEASWEVALHAVGGVLNAIDAIVERRYRNAFCVVRPPGHHATASLGMGFCVFNNIAVGARYAQRKYGIGRVLIIDWDVHHGNGTQDIFYQDASVLFFSTHQSPWYPGTGDASETGEGPGEGTTVNCPLPAGSGPDEIVGAFRQRLLPAVKQFKPELVMISAGFDSRVRDPLGRFMLTDEDFADLTQMAKEIADKYAGGRLVSVLEGGYSLRGLACASLAHVHELER